jgi:hypothetical protein
MFNPMSKCFAGYRQKGLPPYGAGPRMTGKTLQLMHGLGHDLNRRQMAVKRETLARKLAGADVWDEGVVGLLSAGELQFVGSQVVITQKGVYNPKRRFRDEEGLVHNYACIGLSDSCRYAARDPIARGLPVATMPEFVSARSLAREGISYSIEVLDGLYTEQFVGEYTVLVHALGARTGRDPIGATYARLEPIYSQAQHPAARPWPLPRVCDDLKDRLNRLGMLAALPLLRKNGVEVSDRLM